MKIPKNIFITGSTGFLGSHILRQILLQDSSKLHLLIRGKNEEEVEKKGLAVLEKAIEGKPTEKILKRINLIRGDVSEIDLGLSKEILRKLFSNVNEIYHCAAMTGFRIPLAVIRKVNVVGTENILKFAIRCKQIRRLNYISTAFIVGNKDCVFSENDFEIGQKFNNTYEQTKFEAEKLAHNYKKKGLKISIFRPSVIVGEYYSGETTNFRMFYEPLHFLSLELFKEVPVDLEVEHNLVPIDAVAKAIYILAENEKNEDVYHIVSPDNIKCYYFMDLAAKFFGYKNPKWVPLDKSVLERFTPIQKRIIAPFIPYFNYRVKFSSSKTENVLKKYKFEYPEINEQFINRLFNFCHKAGFINKRVNRFE